MQVYHRFLVDISVTKRTHTPPHTKSIRKLRIRHARDKRAWAQTTPRSVEDVQSGSVAELDHSAASGTFIAGSSLRWQIGHASKTRTL